MKKKENDDGGDEDDIEADKAEDDKKSSSSESSDSHPMKFVGIFLAAVSGLFFTLCSVTVKLLPRIDPSEVLLYR